VPFEAAKFLAGGSTNSTPAGKWQISSGGGQQPLWRRDGKELFYLESNTIMAVDIDTSKDGISERDCTMRRAIVAPVGESGMIVVGPFGADASGAPFVAPARSTSRLRIRPPGPVPTRFWCIRWTR